MRNAQFTQQAVKRMAIAELLCLRLLRAEHANARISDHPGHPHGVGSAKLQHRAPRLLRGEDVGDILRGDRVKIKPVGRLKIRRYRVGVVVGDHSFAALPAQRFHTMDRAVILLDPVTDRNRARAQHQHLFPIGSSTAALCKERFIIIIPAE